MHDKITLLMLGKEEKKQILGGCELLQLLERDLCNTMLCNYDWGILTVIFCVQSQVPKNKKKVVGSIVFSLVNGTP